MATLYRNRDVSFTQLRNALGLTDGNLGSHAQKLEDAGYLASRRALVGVSFEVRYRITPQGSAAFRAYVGTLQAVLGEAPADAGDDGTETPPPTNRASSTP